MAKTKISEFSPTPGNNTDIDGINIAENCAPSGINNAIRELMAQLKDFQAGTAGDSFNGPIGTSTAAAGSFTTLTTSGAVTLNGGTANGVAFLNGSKVLTTGSALTFDGTNLGVGTSSPASKLDVIGAGAFRVDGAGSTTPLVLRNNNTASTQLVKLGFDSNGLIKASINAAVFGNDYMTFNVNNDAEQMRLTSTGLGIGTSSPQYPLDVQQQTSDDSYALQLRGHTTGGDGTRTVNIRAVSGNAGDWANFRMDATSFIWRHQGGSERARIDSSGNLLVGTTAADPVDSNVAGISLEGSVGSGKFSRSNNAALDVNRKTNDGELVRFYQDGTQEGSISVSGTTVSYNGGHLARYTQLSTGEKDDTFLKGTVLSNLDAMCVYTNKTTGLPVSNEQLNKSKVSDVEGDVNVAGVFVSWIRDEQNGDEEINMAMTGDMIIRIAQGVAVARGDLLMSAGDGTAKPQGDDIVRSKTVAKVTSTHVTCTYADGSFCVPCVLMAC